MLGQMTDQKMLESRVVKRASRLRQNVSGTSIDRLAKADFTAADEIIEMIKENDTDAASIDDLNADL